MVPTGKESPIVYPIEEALREEHLDNSHISNYILNYLTYFNVKYFLKEEKYVDKDYMIDYSKFYARSFENYSKFTNRIHFFTGDISNNDINLLLERFDKKLYTKIFDSYLGFVVVKPVKNSRDHKLIGRTILRTYNKNVEENPNERRVMIKPKNIVNLFGIRLEVESLPFQTQDRAVGACATTACWISLNQLADLFETPKSSLAEITEKSISFPSESRNFPSTGLNYLQIKNYYNSIGLDSEFIIPYLIFNYPRLRKLSENLVGDIIKAYIKEYNLPIFAGLEIKPKNGNPLYHAVIISGYRHEKGEVKKLYIHDDQIGPYSRVTSRDNFFSWIDAWLSNPKFTSITIDKFVIPIYPKIRLTFKNIYLVYLLKYKEKLQEKIKSEGINPESKYELFLTDVKKYKKFLLDKPILEKTEKLKKPFPRFLWIIRLEAENAIYYDYIYDATAVYAINPYDNIIYRCS